MASPPIHTYHCACTSLLLASTHNLSSLPRRAAPSLDRATILPLPPSPDASPLGHTTLLSMTPDRRATIIRRDDGFEKRILWRCGRCRVVVGYELDEEHFGAARGGEEGAAAGDQGGEDNRTKILYVLPGWIMSTEQMAAGKKIGEGDAVLEPAQLGVAAWE